MAAKRIRLLLLFVLSAIAVYYGSAFALSAQAPNIIVNVDKVAR